MRLTPSSLFTLTSIVTSSILFTVNSAPVTENDVILPDNTTINGLTNVTPVGSDKAIWAKKIAKRCNRYSKNNKRVTKKHTTKKHTTKKHTTKKHTTKKHTTKKHTTKKHTTKKHTTKKLVSAKKHASKKHTTKKHTTKKHTSKKHTTKKHASKKHTTKKHTTKKHTTKKHTTKKHTTKKHTTTKKTTTTKKSTTTSKASSSSSSTQYSGEGTYYTPSLGSCGTQSSSTDLVAALNAVQMNNPANPNLNPTCGKYVNVKGPKGSVRVKIVDTCPPCASGDLDLSPTAFAEIGEIIAGRINITWTWD
ncbi:hypothetical protein CU098_005752 [Rhizopus stolonifer]|uniref:RlpA-like protein double-psi beta-barrel domain-containing protein n=1 Tax=Rhizopus stolonifer TaxID=4846 RepID=A0A367INZ8_RHIST|nr:hypothetical protein CU098_005752 [Rhizopus stolonifer]